MDPKKDLNMEWGKIMESMNKMQDMMKDMPSEGMEDMAQEWDRMMASAKKLQDMMTERDM